MKNHFQNVLKCLSIGKIIFFKHTKNRFFLRSSTQKTINRRTGPGQACNLQLTEKRLIFFSHALTKSVFSSQKADSPFNTSS